MRGTPGAGASWAGAVMALSWVGLVHGYSQLVMEKTFPMATASCEGGSCRKEFVGANETLGVGAVSHCSPRMTYWKGTLEDAPTEGTEKLFDLLYSCRKVPIGGEEEVTLASFEECGMVAEPCVDAGTNPNTSEVTYQIAFEFETDDEVRVDYHVIVDVELYFSYLRVDEAFFTLRSKDAPYCVLNETCHRGCDTGERGFTVELADEFGDGWNAGGINLFDHFRLDSRSELMAEVVVAMAADEAVGANAAATAAVRSSSYKNTMLGGSTRAVPLCLADGEYLFSTEFHTPVNASTDSSGVFSIGGRLFSESTWSFCGATGMLADYTYVSVVDGLCTATQGWGETASPAATPVEGDTPAPADGGGNRGVDDDGDSEEGGEGGEGDTTLTDVEILGIGLGALAVAALAAIGGTYAQNNGWFAAAAARGAAGGAAAGGAAGGGGGGAPDEFAP